MRIQSLFAAFCGRGRGVSGAAMGPALFLACLVALTSTPAHAQLPGLNTTTGVLRAKAAPDECWVGLGMNEPFKVPPCSKGTNKVNSGYVWALSDSGTGNVFFGTLANGQCITAGGLSLQPPPGYVTDSWACEFGSSPYVSLPPPNNLPGQIGDYRPPQIFVYNKSTKAATDISNHVTPTVSNPLGFDPLMETTLGIRAAVTVGDTVILAGPSLFGSLNFFAYNTTTAALLWEANLPCQTVGMDVYCYSNIRTFTTYQGQTYTTVAMTKNGTTIGGAALKLTSYSSTPCATNCIGFLQVGTIPDGQGAYIASHDGRLYVSTWPTGQLGSIASLYMSPAVPADTGLVSNTTWTKVWSVSQYEPDALNQYGYSGGALADFDGYLYWGTIHAPWETTVLFFIVHGAPASQQDALTDIENTFQTASVFRGTNLDSANPTVDLLYGYPYLPTFSQNTQAWSMTPNNMPTGHKDPLYGIAGFGNPYNNYIWSMRVWNNRLWVGTMDWTYMAVHGATATESGGAAPLNNVGLGAESAPFGSSSFINANPGADLMFFQNSNTPAIPESLTGVGNATNYGVRNIVPNSDGSTLFLGMANPMNLLTSLSLGTNKGGWELLELSPKINVVHALTGFTCTPGNLVGPGPVSCTVTLDAAATGLGTLVAISAYPAFPLTIPGMPSAILPSNVWVQPGQTSATFSFNVPEAGVATEYALEAELNGGTRFAGIQLAPGVAKIAGALSSPFHATSQIIGVPVKLTDNGTGEALNLTVNTVVANVLGGSGSISYLGTLWPMGSPATAVNLGTLGAGSNRTVTFYFSVPSTVTRFSVTESGGFTSLAGASYTWSAVQSIFTAQVK